MPRLTLPLVALLIALVAAPTAMAASRNQIIKDCADDSRLQGHYSKSELRDARQNLPSDVSEYTDCADVLRRAELPDSKGGGGGGGTGGGSGGGPAAAAGGGGGPLLTPSTDKDRKQLADAAAAGGQPVSIDGESVVPGASGLHAGATRNGMPGTLLAVLIALALGGIALAVPPVRRALPSLRDRLPFPGRSA
jgi:hypothetical protein